MDEKPSVFKEVLSVREAATRLACSTATVRRMIKNGEIAHLKRRGGVKAGSPYKIPVAEIDRYLKDNVKVGEALSEQEKYKKWEERNAR